MEAFGSYNPLDRGRAKLGERTDLMKSQLHLYLFLVIFCVQPPPLGSTKFSNALHIIDRDRVALWVLEGVARVTKAFSDLVCTFVTMNAHVAFDLARTYGEGTVL